MKVANITDVAMIQEFNYGTGSDADIRTFVNQAWPFDPKYPDGAWGFHETLIPKEPKEPIRIFISVGDKDLLNPNVMRDGMHDWVMASENMAKALAAKGYVYQFVFARNAGHVDGSTLSQTLGLALQWVWSGYQRRDADDGDPIGDRERRGSHRPPGAIRLHHRGQVGGYHRRERRPDRRYPRARARSLRDERRQGLQAGRLRPIQGARAG